MIDVSALPQDALIDFFDKPDLFLWRYEKARALFAEMNRDTYSQSIFTDTRIVPLSNEITQFDLNSLLNYVESSEKQQKKICYIFHVAHCGSTLLSRAMDVKEKTIVYREPMVLRQLGVEYATTTNASVMNKEWLNKLDLAVLLLGRSYEKNSGVIVKANVPVNFMIPELMTKSPLNRAILLYSTLENFLLSALKSNERRAWVEGISNELSSGFDDVINVDASEVQGLTVAQKAACLWAVQIKLYVNAVNDQLNVRTLDSEALFNRPREVLQKSFEYFEHSIGNADIEKIVNSDLYSNYSKSDTMRYDNDVRLGEKKKVKTIVADELKSARLWVESNSSRLGLPDKLLSSLVSDIPELMQ